MKEKINKLLDPNISSKEEDQIFEEILKRKHDSDLRNKWQETLSQEYGINKNISSIKKNNSSKYFKIFLAAAACIALILTIQLTNNSLDKNTTKIAQSYLSTQEILHPGASKGIAEENQSRILAIQAFNNKEYRQSIIHFETLSEVTEEDQYYHAMALLLNNNYQEAIQKFEETNKDRFRQEINWYQSLAYLLNEQNEKAQHLLKQINTSDWNYTLSQELLEIIK
ncbi:hypothetical protein U6A24_13350 [Aquimarina gracilis]|uniref:Tetratricopeptide repeat protein n=1 Tax=Aquimarina gracilis TaxID=874422 RepID=A0ABU5ZX61_9FLAO|nr:hypothetical protein [Aquimarina gracilis]MEB3346457.1 hypothetical protein [Aquimarina gracilis]